VVDDIEDDVSVAVVDVVALPQAKKPQVRFALEIHAKKKPKTGSNMMDVASNSNIIN
jgi:hypothetical protein